jgi:hypothetical protein
VAEWVAELDGEAEDDAEAVAEWVAELDGEAEDDAEAVADWVAELDGEAEDDPVLDVDDVGGFVVEAEAEADPLVVLGALVGVASSLSTVKTARRLVVLPSRQVRTTLILCDPSTSCVVSYGRAVPAGAVPARSNGGTRSV